MTVICSKWSSIEDQAQSPIAQYKILRPQKCQNFHVVTDRDRQTLAEFEGAHVWSVSPQRKMALSFPFSLPTDIIRVKRSQWSENNIQIGLPLHRWIAPACIGDQKSKKGLLKFASYPPDWKVKGKTNTQIIECLCNKLCVLTAYGRYQHSCASLS